ncbi:hypothetical protein Tco_1092588 [Tanacetum coccineum]|uniref:Uncharacterized protein n=1 Tax=Tanacetum coccineum TaxID=301880 RepID=A0ABQ5IAA6_9ASTR
MHEDYEYVKSLEKEVDELEYEKADFSNMYDLLLEEMEMDGYLRDVHQVYMDTKANRTQNDKKPKIANALGSNLPMFPSSSNFLLQISTTHPIHCWTLEHKAHDGQSQALFRTDRGHEILEQDTPLHISKKKAMEHPTYTSRTPEQMALSKDGTVLLLRLLERCFISFSFANHSGLSKKKLQPHAILQKTDQSKIISAPSHGKTGISHHK